MHVYAIRITRLVTAAWTTALVLAEVENRAFAGALDMEVVARVNDIPVFADELDQALALPLHDLDLARYRLRLQGLRQLIQRRLQYHPGGVPSVSIVLERPTPPRLPISSVGAMRRGSPEAPVELTVFCSFQSPECAELQPLLRGLLWEFGDRLSLLVRDLPLPAQPWAGELAEAARCAGEQIDYWLFHDALYARGPELTPQVLEDLCDYLGIDKAWYAACMQAHRHRATVETGIVYARSLGLDKVPVSFVNSFYLPGLADVQEFRQLIDGELFRLNQALSGKTAPLEIAKAKVTQLPLLLTGVVARGGAGAGSAVILAQEGGGGEVSYRVGDTLMPDVTLISISRNKAYLRNAGQLEYLPLTRGPAPLPERLAADTEIGMEPESDADELSGAVEGFVSPDPDIVVTLSRERVQQALSVSDLAQVELEVIAVGQAAEQLVRVSNLESGGIYQLLDLRKGDVLMEVNGEPIRGGADLLLQALENETLVDLAILREDLVPRRLIYDLE